MAQETLKITITADNQQAVQNLQQTAAATQNLGNSFRQIPNSSNQATQSLVNLSRVAQDAPYGFIGIANNLNPLLESFQRLQATAGSAGGALKAMASSLMGPAGIGLALGVVSSLIVAFGPKIKAFIAGTTDASKAEDKFKESLDKARASASENGIKLLAYIGIAENANIADDKRKNALRFVIDELGKINKAYAATITTTDQARNAVNLYTQALVAQAITSRYVDEIADKTIKLTDANKKALAAADEYTKAIERSKTMTNGYVDASVVQAGVISNAKNNYIEAGNAAIYLSDEISKLNTELTTTITTAATNPFNVVTNGAKNATEAVKALKNIISYRDLGKVAAGEGGVVPIQKNPLLRAAPQTINPNLAPSQTLIDAETINQQTRAQELFNSQLSLTKDIVGNLAPAFESVFSAMIMGEDVGAALENAFKQIVIQLLSMIAQALIFRAVLAAITGGTSEIAAGAAGAASSAMNVGNTITQFVLRGSDLVLAQQRANSNLNLKRGR